LDGLKRVGFKLSMGIDGSGFPQLAWERAGGYYLGEIHLVLQAYTEINQAFLQMLVLAK
jgi:hypothetical protein